jgi:sugar lactone lactonase YvrE
MVDDLRLFVSDTGNRRVVRIDPLQGSLGDGFATADNQLADPREVVDVTVEVVVPTGEMQAPSGIAIAGDLLFVGDVDTSRVHVFQLDGTPLAEFDTELPIGALARSDQRDR